MTEHTVWISIAEAAVRLSVSDKTIRRMISRGDLRAQRFGKRLIRVDAESIVGTPIGGGSTVLPGEDFFAWMTRAGAMSEAEAAELRRRSDALHDSV